MSVAAGNEGVVGGLPVFLESDEAAAYEAFDRLTGRTRAAVLRALVRSGVDLQNAEDALQIAIRDLWRGRANLTARSGGEWYWLVRRHAFWAAKRLVWNEQSHLCAELPEADLPVLDAYVEAIDEMEGILRGADTLWLGATEENAEIAAAAVRMNLVHGLPAEALAGMFAMPVERVERWLEDPALVARALFASVCPPGDALAGYVLRPAFPLASEALDALMRPGAVPPEGWTSDEARVVCWRLRNGLSEEAIVSAAQGRLSTDEVERVLARIREELPLRFVARTLRRALEGRAATSALARPELWKRVVFQYLLGELPHAQIVERAAPPAGEASFTLDRRRLNNWISMGRLLSQLAGHLREGRA